MKQNKSVFEVCTKRCDECLFSDNKIVDAKRKADVIADCLERQTHFSCHKEQLKGRDVCCAGFYEEYGGQIIKIRLAHVWELVRKV